MTRKEFIKMCALLGIGLPLAGSNFHTNTNRSANGPKRVVVIGAGAAGLTAAHLLKQQNIDVQILEANSSYGGRMKRTTEFADFPIPTGAEWLHTKRSVLDEIVNDKSVNVETVTKPYNTNVEHALIDGKKEDLKKLGFTIDQKFIGATWFDFFEDYIVPGVINDILFNSPVRSIDHSGETIKIVTDTQDLSADKVIITVPVSLLQKNTIQFAPALPAEKAEAIDRVTVWDGCKAFFEFSEKFYPAATGFNSIPPRQGHKMFFDAAYGQNTQHNIFGVFAVGPVSRPYLERKGDELKDFLLAELDEVYDGKASPSFKKYIFQNWTAEPYAQGAYVHYFENRRNIRKLGKPVDDKLFFAGDAYTDGGEWSSVHAAANSARRAVKQIVAA